jgi:hypothetical protein
MAARDQEEDLNAHLTPLPINSHRTRTLSLPSKKWIVAKLLLTFLSDLLW